MLMEHYSDQCQLGIFQGESLPPLLFAIALLTLTHVLRETGMGKNLFITLNTWAKSVIRNSGTFFDKRRDERT